MSGEIASMRDCHLLRRAFVLRGPSAECGTSTSTEFDDILEAIRRALGVSPDERFCAEASIL